MRTQHQIAVALALFAFSASPVLAANAVNSHCSEATDANLHIPVNDLVTHQVSHNSVDSAAEDPLAIDTSDSLLAPRAEAAIRDAFEDQDTVEETSPELIKAVLSAPLAGAKSENESATESDEQVVPDQGMNTKLPGVSEDDLSRYKKQMYRRDI